MNTSLDHHTTTELSKLFALEVAKWKPSEDDAAVFLLWTRLKGEAPEIVWPQYAEDFALLRPFVECTQFQIDRYSSMTPSFAGDFWTSASNDPKNISVSVCANTLEKLFCKALILLARESHSFVDVTPPPANMPSIPEFTD